jgi:hypothetical protein
VVATSRLPTLLAIPAILTLLALALMPPASAEEIVLREYDRSVIENLRIAIEVRSEYVAGGLDDHGNWVISYAVKRDPDEAKFRELYNSTLKALQIWNASLRYYADKYNCSHLRKLVLRFLGEANETNKPDVLVSLGGTYDAWGIYSPRSKSIVIGSHVPLEYYMWVVAHEIGHSLGLGHHQSYSPTRYDSLIDFRGNKFELMEYMLTFEATPTLMELYALCKLYEPIKDGRKPSLIDVVKLPREMNEEFYIGVGVIQVFTRIGCNLIAEPPTAFSYPYEISTDIYWGLEKQANLLSADLKAYGFGLYGGDVIVYPLRRYEYHPDRVYITGTTPPYVIVRELGAGTLEATVGFNISKIVYGRIYYLQGEGYRDIKLYLLREVPDPSLLQSLKGLPWNVVKYIIAIREEKCAPSECYDSVEWLRDGRILIRNVKADLLVNVDVGRVYSFRIDVPFFGYNYTIRSPKMLREMVYKKSTYAPEGSEIYVRPLETLHDFGNGTRIVLAGWNIGSWNGTHLKIMLDKPVEVRALVKREYLVSVEPPIGNFTNTGWAPEGSNITIRPEEEVIDFGNGTRLVFKGFEGYDGKNVTLTVTSPIRLKALWARQHLVSLESRYVRSLAKWFDEGDICSVTSKKEIDFGNGTIVRLRSITAYMGNKTVEAGDYGDAMRLMLEVRSPITIRAQWDAYHMVSLSSEAPVGSGGPGLYPEGSRWNATAEESIVYGNGTVRKFVGWIVDGQLIANRTISFTVSRPMGVTALWRTYDYVTFMLDAGGGYIVQADRVVLEGEHETVTVNGSGFLERGMWRVSGAWYRGAEVSVPTDVSVRGSGAVTLPSRLRAVKVRAVDILGMPAPNTLITTPFSQAATGWAGEATLHAIPPTTVEAKLRHVLGESYVEIPGDAAEIAARIPLSIYTLTIMVAIAAVFAAYLGLRRWGGRGGES